MRTALIQLAYVCDRAQLTLSPAAAHLHQCRQLALSSLVESAIAALDNAADHLVWWSRPADA